MGSDAENQPLVIAQNPLVIAQNIVKNYPRGVCALDEVSITVNFGEWVSIMGASGSGKSTLINILGSLDKPTKGYVIIDGIEVATLSQRELARFRREKVGLIFQQFYLVPYLNALENVMLAQYYHSMTDEEEAKEALRKVGLGGRIGHLPSELSGGEQQRVCIARALINQPKLILADEPTGSLDAENEKLVLAIFEKLHAEGYTILAVTHDPQVGKLGDRVIYLEHGKIASTPFGS